MRSDRILPLFLVALAPLTSIACGGESTSGTTTGAEGGASSTGSATSTSGSTAGSGGRGGAGGSSASSGGMGGAGGGATSSSSATSSNSASSSASGSSSASSGSASSSSSSGSASSSSSSSSASSSSSGSSSSASSSASGSSSSGMSGSLPSFAVVRVGDGSAPLSSTSQPVYIDEFKTDGTPVGAAINLSTVVGNNQPFSLSGSATSEGFLSLSTNGKYLALPGYAAAPGLASVGGTDVGSAPGSVNRVVARVDAMGNVNTTTLLDSAFAKNNPRGAASVDGTAFWVTGNGSGPAGVQYIPFGQTGSTTVLAAPNNTRAVGIFDGQLFASSGASGYVTVFAVGTGLPTTTGATASLLPGLPITGESPYAFVFFDRDAKPGVETLYVADDKAPTAALPGGIKKYTLAANTWTLQGTFNAGITTGVRGLTGVVTGTSVTLIATTTEASQNKVVVFVDDGSASPTGTVVATAAMNTVYRGVALTPQ